MVKIYLGLIVLISLVSAMHQTMPGRAVFNISYSIFTDKYTFNAVLPEKEYFIIAFNKNYSTTSGNLIVWSTTGDEGTIEDKWGTYTSPT